MQKPRLFERWQDDMIAGLSGAVAGAPQAMGFALIAGVNPIYGLYTAVVSTIVAALAGSSTYMTVGPTNALALVVASSLADFDGAAEIERLFMLTVLVGVFLTLFGVLRLGILTRFVSHAVMTGFISGAGLLIIFGQVQNINGYDANGATALLRFGDWLLHLGQSDVKTVMIAIGAMLTITVLKRTRFKNLATLVAIVGASVVTLGLGWDSVRLVQDISTVPRGLPSPTFPDIALAPELLNAALAMSVVGAVQSAALTNSITEPDGTNSNTSRDFIGMGLGNLAGGVLQGMPACGSLSRTAVNVGAGAKSRFANVFAGLSIAVFLVALGPLVERVTLAALGAQLILAALSLIQPSQIILVWNVNWPARLAMVVTFVSTLVLPLENSIYIGVVLSLLLFVYTSADHLHIEHLQKRGERYHRIEQLPESLPENAISIFGVHGHLYFAAVRRLEQALPNPHRSHCSIVILRLHANDYLGSTGIQFLKRYNAALREKGGALLLSGLTPILMAELQRTRAVDDLGASNLFVATNVYFESTEKAYRRARFLLDAASL